MGKALDRSARVAPASLLPLGAQRVVVIGGGFLGTRIALSAVQRGHRTALLTRSQNVSPEILTSGCRVVIGDAGDVETVQALIRRPAHVVHCAGGRLPTDSIDDPSGDAVGTLAPLLGVLEAIRRFPSSRLTLLSSGGTVYGHPHVEPVDEDHPCRPVVPYGVSRLAAEGYVDVYARLHGVCARILRLGNVYGPGQPVGRRQGIVAALLAAAAEGGTVDIWGDGSVARDYVHVDDVADAVHRLPPPHPPAEVLNVGAGVAHTVLHVADAVQRVTRAPLRLRLRPGRAYDVSRIALSTRRLEALMPYAPMTLEAGIEATWAMRALDGEAGVAATR